MSINTSMMQNFGLEDLSHVQSRHNLLKYLVRVDMASDWFTRIYRSILAEEINIQNRDMACKPGCGLFLSPQLPKGFIKAPGKLTGWKQDLAINLPGCFRLLFLLSFIRKTKNTQLKNPTDLLHKNAMKPLITMLNNKVISI